MVGRPASCARARELGTNGLGIRCACHHYFQSLPRPRPARQLAGELPAGVRHDRAAAAGLRRDARTAAPPPRPQPPLGPGPGPPARGTLLGLAPAGVLPQLPAPSPPPPPG